MRRCATLRRMRLSLAVVRRQSWSSAWPYVAVWSVLVLVLVLVHDVSAMPESSIQSALGWLRHTVRPLLRAAGALGAAGPRAPGGDAVRDCPAARKPYQGGCFRGPEGAGCGLSRVELAIFIRVKHEPMSWEH